MIGLLLPALAVSFLLLRSRRPAVRRDPDLRVLLITLDTTRADRLGCYGYADGRTPALDALAAAGTRFSRAVTPVPLTTPAHSSILTGTYPTVHGVHNNGGYRLPEAMPTLATVLHQRGYRCAAFVSSFTVDSRFGFDRGFELYDDRFAADSPFKGQNAERRAGETEAALAPWLERHARERFFVWVHFYDPHLPYDPPEPWRSQFAGQPYDGEVAYMDEAVGAVLSRLRRLGVLDDTLVVACGDHGEAFGEHGERGHGIFLYEPTLRVPLLMSAPGRLPAGRAVTSRARLVDVMPTILDLLSIPAPAGLQGRSLLPVIRGEETGDRDAYLETFYPRENFGWSEYTGLLRADWKYLQAPQPELYDLAADPGEERNLYLPRNRQARELRRELQSLILHGAPTRRAELSPEERSRLTSLGYLSFAPDRQAPGTALPDAKACREELQLIQDAQGDEDRGDFASARSRYQRLLALRPGASASYISLALAMARLNDFPGAIAVLQQGLGRLPGSEPLLTRLGHTLLAAGRNAEALATMSEVLARNAASFDARLVTALLLGERGDEAAAAHFRAALAIEPENRFASLRFAAFLGGREKWREAAGELERLLRAFPGDAEALQKLGVAYGMAGDFPRAVARLEEAARLEPAPLLWLNLALAYRGQGDRVNAARCLRRFLEAPSGDPQTIEQARRELRELERIPR